MTDDNTKFKTLYGHKASKIEIFSKILIKNILRILKINGRNRFSNWIMEILNPVVIVKSKIDPEIKFKWRTGHNRLLWRAETFDTEEKMMVNWLKNLKKDDIFLDIGANSGIYTIAAACKCNAITAVELDPINISLLKENLVLNNFENKVLIIPLAAGSKNKKEIIYFRSCSKSDALQSIGQPSKLGTRLYEGHHKSLQLLFSLNFLYEEFKLPQPNKIKIDVDGNEKELFEGADRIILNADEIYYEDSGFEDSRNVLNKILEAGFNISDKEKPQRALRGQNLILKK